MVAEHHTRFKDCPWYLEKFPMVTVGGVGGIGSWLSLYLGRIGVPMELFDMDSVDYTNMGGQLFPVNSIGQQKVDVALNNIRTYCGPAELYRRDRFTYGQDVNPIAFSCFDSMQARADMVETWYRQHGRMASCSIPTIFIDGRMTVESFQIYAVTPDRYEQYRDEFIFDDSEVSDPLCSMKATSHIGGMIGSLMTQLFTNYITNHETGMDLRELPLQKCYEASFLDFL